MQSYKIFCIYASARAIFLSKVYQKSKPDVAMSLFLKYNFETLILS